MEDSVKAFVELAMASFEKTLQAGLQRIMESSEKKQPKRKQKSKPQKAKKPTAKPKRRQQPKRTKQQTKKQKTSKTDEDQEWEPSSQSGDDEDDEEEDEDIEEEEEDDEEEGEEEEAEEEDEGKDKEEEEELKDEEEEKAESDSGSEYDEESEPEDSQTCSKSSKKRRRNSKRIENKWKYGKCPDVDDKMFANVTLGYDVMPVVKWGGGLPKAFTGHMEQRGPQHKPVLDDRFVGFWRSPRHLWHETPFYREEIHRKTWLNCEFGHASAEDNGQNAFCYRILRLIMSGCVSFTLTSVAILAYNCEICSIAGHPGLPDEILSLGGHEILHIGRHCANRIRPLIHLWEILNHRGLYKDDMVFYHQLTAQISACTAAWEATRIFYETKGREGI